MSGAQLTGEDTMLAETEPADGAQLDEALGLVLDIRDASNELIVALNSKHRMPPAA